MKKTLFILLLLPFMAFSQTFTSNVSSVNDQAVKMQVNIIIDETNILTRSKQFAVSYNIKSQNNGVYQVSSSGNNFEIVLVNSSGKIKGFNYTHTITLLSLNQDNLPPVVYYCVNQ